MNFKYLKQRTVRTFYTGWLADVIFMTETKLTPIIASEDEESTGF